MVLGRLVVEFAGSEVEGDGAVVKGGSPFVNGLLGSGSLPSDACDS